MQQLLAERLQTVEQRITAACARVGRQRSDVTLIAVTKTVSSDVARLLPGLGVVHLGESRPQELWRKAAALPTGIFWHQVGHLQRNKVERTLPLVHLIHSVDSPRLLAEIDAEAHHQRRRVEVLLEVNASGEEAKHGFGPDELTDLADEIRALQNVSVRGLMTMAAYEDDPERCRATFVLLRQLRDDLQRQLGENYPLPHLSMGMSNDFEIAIEEGATMIRLGTVLFEGLPGGKSA